MRLSPLGTAQLDAAWLRPGPIAATQPLKSCAPPRKASASGFVARHGVAVVALLVGTGGLSTAEYITARSHRGYPFEMFELGAEHPPIHGRPVDAPNAAQTLEHVKAVFEPSITELASVFEVSRQTIYNWQAGLPIAAENLQRLERLARAADLLEAGGLAQNFRVLRRPIVGGKNLFELIRSGSDPEAIARKLVTTIHEETTQRRRLEVRLANRRKKPVDIDDIGSPHLNGEP